MAAVQERTGISEVERRFILQRALQGIPEFDNSVLWLGVISAVSTRRTDQFLRLNEADAIIDVQSGYEKAEENISIAKVVTEVGLADLSEDKVLRSVAFNFTSGQSCLVRPLNNAPGEFAKAQLRFIANVSRREVFDLTAQAPEEVLELTGRFPSRKDRVISRVLAGFSIITFPLFWGLPSLFTGELGHKTGGWKWEEILRSGFQKNVLPYLAEDEIVKPVSADLIGSSQLPLVVKRTS